MGLFYQHQKFSVTQIATLHEQTKRSLMKKSYHEFSDRLEREIEIGWDGVDWISLAQDRDK
jgi:hypothetical protein